MPEVNDQLFRKFEELAPFGRMNPEPVFLFESITYTRPVQHFGRNHVKLFVRGEEREIEAVGFGLGEHDWSRAPARLAARSTGTTITTASSSASSTGTPPDPMRSVRKLGVVASLAAMLAACGSQEKASPPPSPPPATNAVPPAITNLAPVPKPDALEEPVLPPRVVELQSLRSTPVIAKQSGYLVRQVTAANAFVTPGSPLFQLDPKSGGEKATSIASPAAGMLDAVTHGAGDWIKAGDTLAYIEAADPITVSADYPRDIYDRHKSYFDALGVKAVSPPQVQLILTEGTPYPQKPDVVTIYYLAGKQVVRLEAEFPNPDHVLRPGELVTMREAAMPAVSQPASPPSR